jgi:hypothetical protein
MTKYIGYRGCRQRIDAANARTGRRPVKGIFRYLGIVFSKYSEKIGLAKSLIFDYFLSLRLNVYWQTQTKTRSSSAFSETE